MSARDQRRQHSRLNVILGWFSKDTVGLKSSEISVSETIALPTLYDLFHLVTVDSRQAFTNSRPVLSFSEIRVGLYIFLNVYSYQE